MLKVALFCALLATTQTFAYESTGTAAKAINSLGIELLARTSKPDQNALLSPYSIQSALAMAYAGADGVTRAEMARVLHYPTNDTELHGSFAAMQRALDEIVQNSKADSEREKKQYGLTNDSITLAVANRLFGQSGYDFRPPFWIWSRQAMQRRSSRWISSTIPQPRPSTSTTGWKIKRGSAFAV